MATTIHCVGFSVEVIESYNIVRHRLNLAMANWARVQSGDVPESNKGLSKKPQPAHEMSFTMADDDGDPSGRVTINVEKYIMTTSDELKDVKRDDEDDE
jgi:hypothetical protein